MSTINQLLESANPWQSLQSDAARLASKWTKSGLLEGLSGYDKTNMSMLLENQAKELIVETNTTAGATSGFTTGQGYQWAGVALPMVRKIFGQVVAKEFVSVQPMQMPTGLIFYLDFQYGTTKAPFTAGDSLYGTPAPGFGNSNFDNLAEGGYYGAGRFGYSRNEFSASGVSASAVTPITTGSNFYLINFDSNYINSCNANEIHQVVIQNSLVNGKAIDAGIASGYTTASVDTFGVQAFYFTSGSVITSANILADYTTITNTATTFYVSGTAAAVNNLSASAVSSSGGTLYWLKQGSMNPFNVGDYESGNNPLASPNVLSYNDIEFPELNIKLTSDSITAETRKLKAQWTPEFAQDLNAYQNLDAEAELTSMLSEQISMEIDLEILGMLITGASASNTQYWSAKVGNQINSTGTAFVSNTNGVYYNQMSWFQTLGIKLQKVSNLIHQKTLRGGANFMVISPSVATILESIPGFAADNTDAETMKYAFGVQKVGSINGRYKVYKNPYMKWNTILLGYKGTQFLETGAVYAPYVPLIMTPLIYDPTTFTPRKGVMTRYAKKMLRPDYYGKIEVADLQVV
jgi:hypothetical protein